MRLPTALALGSALAFPGSVGAEQASPSAIVCDDLVSLRRLMAEVPDRTAAQRHLAEHPACRAVDPARIGEVERRAMIGGAPFECVRVGESGCVWLLP